MSFACAVALEQVEKSVKCDQCVSRNERKGVENSGESCTVVWFRDSATEEKTGGRAGGGKDGKCWASLWEWPGWRGPGSMELKGQMWGQSHGGQAEIVWTWKERAREDISRRMLRLELEGRSSRDEICGWSDRTWVSWHQKRLHRRGLDEGKWMTVATSVWDLLLWLIPTDHSKW